MDNVNLDRLASPYGLKNALGLEQERKRGMYFSLETKPLPSYPTYDEVKGLLPQPIISDPKGEIPYTACFDFAIEILYQNIHYPTKESGFVSAFVDAAFNEDVFLWDTAFMTLFCNLLHPYVPGICSLDNFYVKQFSDGEIPREMVRQSGKDFPYWVNKEDKPLYSYFHNAYGYRGLKEKTNIDYKTMYKPDLGRRPEKNPYLTLDNLNHPILALAEWESYRHTGDKDRLQRVFPPLLAYYRAMKYHLQHQNKLFVTDWASMDNSPRNAILGLGVDISSEMVLFGKNLLQILAEIEPQLLTETKANIKNQVEAVSSNLLEQIDPIKINQIKKEINQDISEISHSINHYMWNSEDGFYYDIDFTGKQSKIKTIAAFWTLLSGVASKEQQKSLIGYLQDPNTFKRKHSIPVLAANEAAYDPQGGYWCGSVWAPTNAMVILGLESCGNKALAREIALQHLDAVCEIFQSTGTIWENYPADSLSSGQSDHPDFVGWSGIAPILYLLKYKIGLEFCLEKQTLVWQVDCDIKENCPIGCKNYWFDGKTADVEICLKNQALFLRIKTKAVFDLEIHYKQKTYLLHIEEDTEKEVLVRV